MIGLKSTFVAILVPVLLVPGTCWSQAAEVDQISGTVVDSTGAAVAGAQVKATQMNTGLTQTATTTNGGYYELASLPIGPYKLTVTAAGFKTTVQEVVLQVNVNPTANFSLAVGSVQQQVVVEASPSMAETETAAVGQVINDKAVVDLPLNGRNPAQLVTLSGGSVAEGGFLSSKNYPSSESIAVAGGDTNGTTFLMDGGYDDDVFSAVNLPLPFPDVLQEFSVQTSSIPATYGERSGGVVNVVTKSGTNDFHGDAFEFVRNGYVNAINYFATKVDEQKRNQFGGTLGGPIKRDRLFFFGGWQQTILKTAPPTTISFTPTAQELQGNFSAISKQLTNPSTGKSFPGNQIPTSDFSQASLNVLKYIPVGTGSNGEVEYPIPSPSTENQYLGRIDWNQSQRDRIFGRYFYTKYSNPAQFGGDLLLTTNAGVIDTVQILTLGDTFTLSQKAINNLHYTWTYEHINRGPAPGVPSISSLGINVAPSPGNSPQISVSTYFTTMCGTCSIAKVYSGADQVADDLLLIRGRHQFSVGGEWVRKNLNYNTTSQQNIADTFNGSLSGNALVDFMLGVPSTFQEGNDTLWNPIMNYFALYASDEMRLGHRLTLTAGVRWEPYLPQHDALNRASHFDQGALGSGTVSSVFVNAPAGMTFPGDKGFPSSAPTYRSLAQIGPRLGLVWDVRGNANTIVHAGFGILDDGRSDLETFDRFGFEPPWASLVTLSNPAGGWANPFSAYPGGNPFPLPIPPVSNAPFVSEGTYVNMPLHVRPSYYQEWNLSVQQQVGRNWLFSANYMGNEGVHVWSNYQADPAKYIPGACGSSNCSTVANTNSRRILNLTNTAYGTAFASMTTIDDGATSSYAAVLASVNRRLDRNVSLLFNYTWAHCINQQDVFVEITNTSQNPFNLGADRGNCASDLRQSYNVSVVAGVPHMTGGFAKLLISDWRFSGILSGRSGFWFSPTTGTDASLTGVNADRPNVSGNPNNFQRTLHQWFNKGDYTENAPGAYGDAGRNSLLGPGGYEPDLAIFRDIRYQLHDKPQDMELRLEGFNATNHPEFSNPTSTYTSAQFGQILTTANNARIMQLSFKYIF